MSVALGTAFLQHKAAAGTTTEWWWVAGTAQAELAWNGPTDYSDAWPLATQRRYQKLGWASPTNFKTTQFHGGQCPRYVRMLQPSPIVVWLLFAATFCIDAVIFINARAFRGDFSTSLFFGLAFGQISVATIWAAYSRSPMPARFLVLCAAAAIASLLTSRVEPLELFQCLALYAANITFLMLALLVLRAVSRRYGHEGRRFSILQLLASMTIVAIVMVLLRNATTLQEEWVFTGAFIVLNTVIALASLFFSDLDRHWILRLAGVLGVGLIAGWCLTFVRPNLSGDLEAMGIVQAFMVFVWIDATRIAKAALGNRPKRQTGSNQSQNAS